MDADGSVRPALVIGYILNWFPQLSETFVENEIRTVRELGHRVVVCSLYRPGPDVVHDTVGGKTFTSSFSLVRPYGDLVSNVESPWEEEAVKVMHDRNLRVSFAWMPAPAVFGWEAHRERQRKILEQAAVHFDAGELRIQVGATFPLERAADAHRALEAGQVIGKVVLTMDS